MTGRRDAVPEADDEFAVDGAAPVLRLVPSAEPSAVFTSLAAQCVAELCDSSTVDIVDDDARYRIVYPPQAANVGGLLRIADRGGAVGEHTVRVPFSHPGPAEQRRRAPRRSGPVAGFSGVATFAWHRCIPTRLDRVMVTALVELAVQTVVLHRTELHAQAAAAEAAQLEEALQSSRHIGAAVGIVMSLLKASEDRSFELLRLASQHSNRKLRDVALEVIDTGWLDPALVNAPDK